MNKIQKYFSLVLLSSMPTLYGEQEAAEQVMDQVGKAVRVVVETVEEKAKEGRDFLTSAAPLVLEGIHAKKAQRKADQAWEDREMMRQETAQIAERKELVKNEISELQHEVKHAEKILRSAQEALYVREAIDPHLESETLVDKIEEGAVAAKDMFVQATTGAKNAVVSAAGAVADTVKAIPSAAKYLAASTSAKTESIIQDARAKHAQAKARDTLRELNEADEELNELYKKRDSIQHQLWEIKRQTDFAHESLVEAQRVAALRNEQSK